jgi:hypothetical protein
MASRASCRRHRDLMKTDLCNVSRACLLFINTPHSSGTSTPKLSRTRICATTCRLTRSMPTQLKLTGHKDKDFTNTTTYILKEPHSLTANSAQGAVAGGPSSIIRSTHRRHQHIFHSNHTFTPTSSPCCPPASSMSSDGARLLGSH